MKIKLEKIKLDLKVNWKLSRNETLLKENYILTLESSGYKGVGEVAPNIRYGEDEAKIQSDFSELKKIIDHSSDFEHALKKNRFCNSFSFALDSAYLDIKLQMKKLSFYDYFELKKIEPISTSFSVPIMEEDLLENYMSSISRFESIKVKVNKENAVSFVKAIAQYTKKPLRVDGNEAFDSLDEYLAFESAISDLNIEFIEQPFKTANISDYKKLKPISKFLIIADESVEKSVDFDLIEECFHGINVKLMKAGTIKNAIDLLTEAKQRGLKTMIGCMIETSLGIHYAMKIASLADYCDLDGSLLIKNDPYHFLAERDGSLFFK